MTLEWSQIAMSEYDDLLHYLLVKWGEKVMTSVLEKVEVVVNQILINPRVFPISRLSQPNIRKALLTKHSFLVFECFSDKIVILSIWDTRQSPSKFPY